LGFSLNSGHLPHFIYTNIYAKVIWLQNKCLVKYILGTTRDKKIKMLSWAVSKTIKIAVKILTCVPYACNIWISYYNSNLPFFIAVFNISKQPSYASKQTCEKASIHFRVLN